MTATTLLVAREGGVATVMLARPEVRNAFNQKMIAELARAFEDLGHDASVRAVVLTAQGPAFCAGADLNWMKKMAGYSKARNRADAMGLASMLQNVYLCPKPVVACVHGDCYAGGMGLVAACDIAVAAQEASFCLSEVKLGLIPATISPYVIKAMGENAARRYFLTAERFTAAEAYRIGFVHDIAPIDALDETIDTLLEALLRNGPEAVAEAKRLVREVAGQPLSDALVADTAERIAMIRASDEGRDGIRSFLEKTKPKWIAP